MDFSKVKSLTIPEGGVTKIMSGNVVLWTKPKEPAVNSGKQKREKGLAIELGLFLCLEAFRDLREYYGIFR